MRPRPATALALAALGGLLFPAFFGCGGGQIKLCGEIPEGGCPIGRGGTCADVTCLALYDCVDGAWTLSEQCSPSAGGGGHGGGGADAGPGGDACAPVMIDHTGETTGCMPDLENPDCPAAAAEECGPGACLTGCIDFFLCKKDGWTEVAYCDDQGTFVLVKP